MMFSEEYYFGISNYSARAMSLLCYQHQVWGTIETASGNILVWKFKNRI
jgi:hypothetical protein